MSEMKLEVVDRLRAEFGPPSRDVVKVKSWDLSKRIGIVVQLDGPTRENAAYVWLPYPGEGQQVPEVALEYPGEAGRHSGTYATAGLKRGEPALKLTIRTPQELNDLIGYVCAMLSNAPLPDLKRSTDPQSIRIEGTAGISTLMPVDVATMPILEQASVARIEHSEIRVQRMLHIGLAFRVAAGYKQSPRHHRHRAPRLARRLHGDPHVLPERGQKLHQPADREVARAVAHQSRDVRRRLKLPQVCAAASPS